MQNLLFALLKLQICLKLNTFVPCLTLQVFVAASYVFILGQLPWLNSMHIDFLNLSLGDSDVLMTLLDLDGEGLFVLKVLGIRLVLLSFILLIRVKTIIMIGK